LKKNHQMSKSSSNNTDIVQPFYISSDKELATEFQSFYKFLSDTGLLNFTFFIIFFKTLTEADWSKRSENLRRLRAIILGGAAEYDSFYPLLQKLIPGLNAQVIFHSNFVNPFGS